MHENQKHGKKFEYDPKWKGPLVGRSCTDRLCLVIFLAFVGGWSAIGYFAYVYGDIRTLLIPIDSEGRMCGRHPDVENKPYLLFFDLTKCINISTTVSGCNTPQVCVEECPKMNYFWDIHNRSEDLSTLRSDTICKAGIDVENTTREQIKEHIDDNACARWYLESNQITGRCIPKSIPTSFLEAEFPITPKQLSLGINSTTLLIQLDEFMDQVRNDFGVYSWTILAILGCGALFSMFYILMLRWFATPIIWLSIIGVCGLLGYGSYLLCRLYIVEYETSWLVLAIICGVLLTIVLLVSIFLRHRIRLACQLIGEASKAVLSITSTLVFPLVPWVFKIALLTYALIIAAQLSTWRVQNYTVQLVSNCNCPEEFYYKNGTSCSPEAFQSNCTIGDSTITCGGCYVNGTKHPWFSKYMHVYNVIGFLWMTFFMSALGEMVLAGTFATWYWTFRKSDVPFFTLTTSLWRTLRYHIGTLAFGSLIITICRLIRFVLEYIDTKLRRYDNELTNFLLKCMRCYFWLLERFLKFINKNAYIMCAIHGKSFCVSAKSAFQILMRNIIRVFVLNKITDWLLFMGKILVTALVAWGSWWYVTHRLPEVRYWQVPVAVVIVGTYLIASLFFSVYSVAVDTLFLCFLEDSERNDGTPEKPYYMSKSLRKILNK